MSLGTKAIFLMFTPYAHHDCKDTIDFLRSLVNSVEGHYDDNKRPPHLNTDDSTRTSIFRILDRDSYLRCSDSQIQEILRSQAIVVKREHSGRSFKEALEDLAPLDSFTFIQDQSLPEQSKDRTRRGPVGDILKATESSEPRILNALYFPNEFAGYLPSKFSSDAHAIQSIRGQEGWVNDYPFVGDCRYGIAGTEAACSWWHIDSDGFGTYVDVVAGAKLWFIARPRFSNPSFDHFNHISLLFNQNFDLNKPGMELFDVEAILLESGTRLIMRPNTLHAVYTIKPAVCTGGHYYATSTMRDTFVGLVHTFICDRYITNAEHGPSRFIQAQLINFYHSALVKSGKASASKAAAHVPNPMEPAGLMDLLIACALGVLMNVLAFQTYMPPNGDANIEMNVLQAQMWENKDANQLLPKDRAIFCLARGQSFEIIAWLSSSFKVRDGNMASPQKLFTAILVQMCRMILLYKRIADANEVAHHPNFTQHRLQLQITALLSMQELNCPVDCQDSKLWTFSQSELLSGIAMLPALDEQYSLQRIPNASFTRRSFEELLKAGETARDRMYALWMHVKVEQIGEDDGIDRKRKQAT